MSEKPKFTFGFNRDGLAINGKKFHPLNLSFKNLKLESDREYTTVDPMKLLESLTSLNTRGASDAEKLNALKTILNVVNP